MRARALLLEMNQHLIAYHTTLHGETQPERGIRRLNALLSAKEVYLKLVEYWAGQNLTPLFSFIMYKEGQEMYLQYCKGTLRRYVPREKWDFTKFICEPLSDYDRILMREEALGLGEIEWQLDVLDPLRDE